MVTKQDLMLAEVSNTWGCNGLMFHYGDCSETHGSRSGVKVKVEQWRGNGALKTWKRSPEKFRLPIKFGLYDYSEINERNCDQFHLASQCPVESARR